MASEKTGHSKVTNHFILPRYEPTVISEYISVNDPTINFGNGHIITQIKSVRLIGGQTQISGKYQSINSTYDCYEQIAMIPKEYLSREIFAYTPQIDAHNSKFDNDKDRIVVFKESELEKHRLPSDYTVPFHTGEEVWHKPQPYFHSRRRRVISEEPRKVKVKTIAPNLYAFDLTQEVEIEPTDDCKDKDFKGGWTHSNLIRHCGAQIIEWDTSFAALIHSKLDRAQEYKVTAYLSDHCLDPSTLPLYLVKGSSYYGNKKAFEQWKDVRMNRHLLDTEVMYKLLFTETMEILGQKAIKQRLAPVVGGFKPECTFSNANVIHFGISMSNIVFEQCLKEGPIAENNIVLSHSTDGYILSFTTTLRDAPWLRALLGESNMSATGRRGTKSVASPLEDIIVAYHTKKSVIIVKKFGYTCV